MITSHLRRRLVLEDLIRRAATDWFAQHGTNDLWHGFLVDILDEARFAANNQNVAA